MGKHSDWRKIAKKARRKRIRQSIASKTQKQDEEDRNRREQSPSYQEWVERQKEEEEFGVQEEARLRAEREVNWLKVEEEAQKHWRELQKKLEESRKERERQNALIRMEWEREQHRLRQLKEQKERERDEKIAHELMLQQQIDDFIDQGGCTPEHLKGTIEMNPNKPICPFFQKTSACRFGDSCSRNHIKPTISRTLLIPNFYSHYSLEQTENEHGNDSSLEFENDETYSHFKEFFFDVLPEMEQCGRVTQFKVCCNTEIHLRGNVYVEYSSTRESIRSYRTFNGRWYGGKQLSVEFCNIDSWKSAICGLHFKARCPKGSACNFLHVFRNPNNLFRNADNDYHRTPERERNWRWSESPERISLNCDVNKNSKRKLKKKDSRKRSRTRSRSRSHSKRSRHKTKKSRR